jgi:hypothetical protein
MRPEELKRRQKERETIRSRRAALALPVAALRPEAVQKEKSGGGSL